MTDTVPSHLVVPPVGAVVEVVAVDPSDNMPRMHVGDIIEVACAYPSPRIPDYVYVRATKDRRGEGTWCRVRMISPATEAERDEGVNAELELYLANAIESYSALGDALARLTKAIGGKLNRR